MVFDRFKYHRPKKGLFLSTFQSAKDIIRSQTMVSSVRLDGSTACMVVDGATTKDIFEAYIEQVLLPTLKVGDIVVLDNLSAHKSQAGSGAYE